MKRIILLLVLLFIPALAQAKIYILIDEAADRKFPIAVPVMTTGGGSVNSLSEEITGLIKKDLEIAGIFKVIDEKAFVKKDTDAVDHVDFSKWTAIEAMALVKGTVNSKGGKIILEARLYDTQTQALLVGKQYLFSKKEYPAAVHRFVDEIMKALTGIPGPFSSKVVAACGKTGVRQIYTFAIDGSQYSQVTKIKGNNISPNWAPGGTTIAFTSFMKYYPEVFTISAGGGGLRQITNLKTTTITPSFSPSGDLIVYASSKNGDTELYQTNSAGKTARRLTNSLNIDVSPAWSPDGSRLVFASERAGNLHLFSMGADGGGTSRLTFTGYQNDQPDWSADGKKIVFTARDRGAFDIFLMNADGSYIQRVTRDEGNNESPTWSPDSRYISFSRGNSGIFIMLADGNNQIGIPNTAGCINPDWSGYLQ